MGNPNRGQPEMSPKKFQVHFQYQKNPKQFEEFKEFQNHWAP